MLKLSVSSLLRYLKYQLDNDDKLQKIYVSGEISNYHRHYSGHLYFTLKDDAAAINCVMFKSSAASLSFEPKNGDSVLVYADTSIFETTGQLQLYVKKITLDGLGELYAKYEALKLKLEQEGKFKDDHKISLDKTYLEKVAVLVGDKSAAMSDIKIAFNRRWPLCEVDYYPVLVQGNDAPKDIIPKLIEVDKMGYDAIILARGGGSFEDLFCFNDEDLVNTIYNLKTFIVTGIGHEQDFSLADFVADLRAATPTAAVELITPNIYDVLDDIDSLNQALKDGITYKLDNYSINFDYLFNQLMHFHDILNNQSELISSDINRIKHAILYKINLYNEQIRHNKADMSLKLNLKLNEDKLTYKRLSTLLDAYSSTNVLKRGYTLVFQDDELIKTKKQLKDKEFEVKFIDGTIKAIERK